MEVLYMKRINYAVITLTKNYSKLGDKPLENEKDKDIFLNINKRFFNVPPKRNNKKTKFFHSKNFETYEVNKATFKNISSFVTQKDRQIKLHYNNPFAEITIKTYERKIIKNGDRIIVKLYKHIKSRTLNDIYFKKYSEILSLSINTTTGDIIFCDIHYSGKSKKGLHKKIRKNSFIDLYEFLSKKNLFRMNSIFDNLDGFEKQMYEQDNFFNILNDVMGINFEDNNESIYKNIVQKFIEIKKLKLPNSYDWRYIVLFYPGSKILKKNKNNLYNAILDFIGIKSKSTIKHLNLYPSTNMFCFALIGRLFGNQLGHHLKNLNMDKFNHMSNSYDDSIKKQNKNIYNSIINRHQDIKLSEKDMICLIEYINNSENKMDSNKINQIYDHFNMINKLRKFDLDIHMTAKNDEDFTNEHFVLSDKLMKIQKEYYSEKIFDSDFINNIEIEHNSVIDTDFGKTDFKCCFVLLKNEFDYNNEANHMHHCVSSYFENNNSIIISIRDKNSKDRVTCEFEIKTGNLLQAKSFCNQPPLPKFDSAIEKIKQLISKYARNKKIAPLRTDVIKNNNYIEQNSSFSVIF